VRSLYALVLDSLAAGASEITIEPRADTVVIRTRLDGRLVDRGRLPRPSGDALLGRLRLLAGAGEEPAPLVTYATTRFDTQPVELEVAFTPGRHGESATVQLWRDGLADPDRILGAAVTAGASDIVLLEGAPPTLRVDRVTMPLPDARPLGAADLRKLMWRLLLPSHRAQFEATGEANVSHVHPELGRFRVTCYRAMGATGMVLHRVKTDVPHLETLALPPVLASLAMERRGLVLVAGATGSGTSTTVAAMLDYRNSCATGHIVTIEDPIEFVHARKQSVVSQREVGVDTESHAVALRTALRQSPDVIFVGELHERDTAATVLRAAESGHLVLSTLHASSAAGAVEQLLGLFPVDARDGLLMQLSLVLRAVIAQRLVPRSDGKGHVAAVEVVLNTPRVQALLRRGELELWGEAAENGGVDGSQSLDQALLALYRQRTVSQDDALRFADSPDAVRLRITGIK
jgi:pilus retraction protein PilT